MLAVATIALAPQAGQTFKVGEPALFDATGQTDASFRGGDVAARWHLADRPCGDDPDSDNGNGAGAGNRVLAAGAHTIDQPVSLVPGAPGDYFVCGWVRDSAGNVLARASYRFTATASPAGSSLVLAGWRPRTAACDALKRSEVVREMGAGVRHRAGGAVSDATFPPITGTRFEHANGSVCIWQAASGMPALEVVLVPQPRRATLGRTVEIFRASPRACHRIAGVGAAACTAAGRRTTSTTIWAVKGRLGVEIFVNARARSSFARQARQDTAFRRKEVRLLRKVLARVRVPA